MIIIYQSSEPNYNFEEALRSRYRYVTGIFNVGYLSESLIKKILPRDYKGKLLLLRGQYFIQEVSLTENKWNQYFLFSKEGWIAPEKAELIYSYKRVDFETSEYDIQLPRVNCILTYQDQLEELNETLGFLLKQDYGGRMDILIEHPPHLVVNQANRVTDWARRKIKILSFAKEQNFTRREQVNSYDGSLKDYAEKGLTLHLNVGDYYGPSFVRKMVMEHKIRGNILTAELANPEVKIHHASLLDGLQEYEQQTYSTGTYIKGPGRDKIVEEYRLEVDPTYISKKEWQRLVQISH